MPESELYSRLLRRSNVRLPAASGRNARIAAVSNARATQAAITTHGAPPRERLALWGEVLWRQFGSVQSEAFADPHFDGSLVLGALGDVRLCRIDASRHMVTRTRSGARRDGRGDVKVVAQLAGSACFEQDGRRAVLQPGDWSVYDTAKPYVVTNPCRVTHVVVLVPRERLRGLGGALDAVTVRRFGGRAGASRRTFELLAGALEDAAAADAAQAARAADRLAETIGAALLERAGVANDRALGEAMRDRVLAYIDANLRDPAMTLDRVAAAVGCGKRNLHKLFHDQVETLGEYIWRARLARARGDLAAPALRARSITEIAFSWGFSSSPHFSRAFRARYGTSPRGYRARAGAGT